MRRRRAAFMRLRGLFAAAPLRRLLAAAPLRRLLAGVLILAAGAAGAQEPASPILTIEPERLATETLYGERIQAEFVEASRALEAENARLAAELEAEELELTERRAEMAPTEFRALAEAFDARVQRLRAASEDKDRERLRANEEARQDFFRAATPILGELMQERGASLMLERGTAFLALGTLDVTDEAIARIDSALGDGSDLPPPGEHGVPPEDTTP